MKPAEVLIVILILAGIAVSISAVCGMAIW